MQWKWKDLVSGKCDRYIAKTKKKNTHLTGNSTPPYLVTRGNLPDIQKLNFRHHRWQMLPRTKIAYKFVIKCAPIIAINNLVESVHQARSLALGWDLGSHRPASTQGCAPLRASTSAHRTLLTEPRLDRTTITNSPALLLMFNKYTFMLKRVVSDSH